MTDVDPLTERLRDFKRLLDGVTIAGADVFVERAHPLPAHTRACILIDPVDEAPIEEDTSFDEVDHDESIAVQVRVSCVGRSPAERDALKRETRVALDAGLGEVHRGLVSTAFSKDGDVDPPVFVASLTYSAVYTA